jgi:hypothetical protein
MFGQYIKEITYITSLSVIFKIMILSLKNLVKLNHIT